MASKTGIIDRATQDFERERVPQEKLRSWWDILAVQFGFIFGSSSLVWAMQFTKGLNFVDTIIAFVVGHFIVFWIFMLNGMLGIRERLSTMFIAQQSFGRGGAYLVSLLITFAVTGWMGAQVAATTQGVWAATGWNPTLINVVVGLCMTFTATWGFQGLKRLSDLSVPYFLVLCVIGIVIAWGRVGGLEALLALQPAGKMAMRDAISAVIGSIVVMGVVTPDITRYARSDGDWAVGAFISFVVGHMVIPLAGVLMALAVGSSDVGKVSFALLGWWGVLMLILSGWTTGDNDIYSGSLAMAQVIPGVKKWKIALSLGILGTFVAVAGILKYLLKWMVLLSAVAPPVFGVMQADYWILPLLGIERGLAGKRGDLVSLPALLAWATGIAAFYGIKWGTPVVNSVVVTMVVYSVLSAVWHRAVGKAPLSSSTG